MNSRQRKVTEHTYRVGIASDPRGTDPTFHDIEEARNEASKWIGKHDIHTPIGTWDDQCNIIHLWLMGQEFRPA